MEPALDRWRAPAERKERPMVLPSTVVLLWTLLIPPGGADASAQAKNDRARVVTHYEARSAAAFGLPDLRSGEDCPAGSLCGQDVGACGSTQWFFYSDLEFCMTPQICGRVRCENFPPPGVTIDQPVGVISWKGVYVDDDGNGCSKPEHQFRIRFYEDAGGAPANPLVGYYTQNVVATAVDTGQTVLFASVPATIWQFTATLSSPVNLTSGWFTIAGEGTPGCYHMWLGSNEGDNKFYQWYETGGSPPGASVTDYCDLGYCLGGYLPGACCDECNLECYDFTNELFCAGIGGRFAPFTVCMSLWPPCGQALGACCHDDGACELRTCRQCVPPPTCVGDLNCDGTIGFSDINPFVVYLSNYSVWHNTYPDCPPENGDINCDGTYGQSALTDVNPFVVLMSQCNMNCPCPGPLTCAPRARAQGTYWAGPNTTCSDCCVVVVPPDALREDEPNDCAPDTFNGGCDITPPLFTPIQPGWTIYGESGTFAGHRDMDWYQTTTGAPTSFTVTVDAEFDVIIYTGRQGPNGPADPCPGWREVSSPVGPPTGGHNMCTPVVLVTRCLPAGTYWFIVAPADFDGVRCASDYKITLETASPCDLLNTCANCSEGAYVEGTNIGWPGYCTDDAYEPDPNGGCNVYPPAFELLPEPGTEPVTFCGKLWANAGFRDLDWYGLNVPVRTRLHWAVMTEVPCLASLLFGMEGGGDFGPPADCSGFAWWSDALFQPCVPGTWDSPAYYAPGFYWFLVVPQDQSGSIFYGYPCPMGGIDLGSDYQITLTGVPSP
jgi:hypothetical protein